MFDPLVEFQIILGVFLWLALHHLMVLSGQRRAHQRWLERRHRKAVVPQKRLLRVVKIKRQ